MSDTVTTTKETNESCECSSSSTTESDGGSSISTTSDKPDYIIPPIGTKGTFTFLSPFNEVLYNDQEYEVVSIRSLKELYDSEEDPLTYIYEEVGLTSSEFQTDLDWNVPIIVFTTEAGKYLYVPASYLGSLPNITGVRYQQVMLAVNLGYLPVNFDLEIAKDTIKEDILGTLGITSTVEAIKTSAVQMVDEDEDEKYKKLLEGKKTINSSYKIRYLKLVQINNTLRQQIKMMNNCMVNHLSILETSD